MSQQSLYTALKLHKKWITLKELRTKLNQNVSSLSTNATKLLKQKDIIRKRGKDGKGYWTYFYKVK
jgi:predicted DNA-binding ArsR family transcriptional regulator